MKLSRKRRVAIPTLLACVALALGAAKGVSAPQTVDVVLAEKAAPPVKSGAEELRHALEMRGLRVRVTSELTPRPGRSSRPGESCKFFRSGLS